MHLSGWMYLSGWMHLSGWIYLFIFDISKSDYFIQQNLHNVNIKGLQHRVAEILGLEYHSLWLELIFFIMDTIINNKIELIRLICILTR